MRKVRKIQAKRKACFTNKKGKKQCYILKVARKYRANPEDIKESRNLELDVEELINQLGMSVHKLQYVDLGTMKKIKKNW